jgi:hypothetical protein
MKRGHLRGDRRRIGDHHLHLERMAGGCGQSALKVGQDAGEQVVPDRGAGSKPQQTDLRFAIARPALEPTCAIEQRQRLREHRTPVVVELQALTDPVEEPQLEQALELDDGRARGRLRQCQPGGSGGGAAPFGHGAEYLQLAQREAQGGHPGLRY